MDVQIINFKSYASGAMIGFCDLQVGGLTIRGCKLFQKDGDKVWLGFPSEKKQDREGKDAWVDVVTCSEPFARHLQALLRPQIRQLIEASGDQDQKPPGKPKFAGSSFRGEHGDRGYQESRKASKEGADIPF